MFHGKCHIALIALILGVFSLVISRLTTNDAEPRQLPLPEGARKNAFVDFVQELRGQGTHFLSPEDPFRATEVALKARNAADKRQTVPL